MSYAVTKINPLFTKQKKCNWFNAMIILCKILQILSGLNYGFFIFKSPKAVHIVKFLSFTVCVTLCGTCVYYYFIASEESQDVWFTSWFSLFLTKYMITGLFLLTLSPNETFYNFHCELRSIDFKLGVESASFKIEFKIMCISVLYIVFRILNCLMFCLDGKCFTPFIITIIYLCVFTCSDMLLILYSFLFYSINCRLKKLFSLLIMTQSNFSSKQLIYKLYVDNIEKYKKVFDPLMIITLFFKIPEIMATIYLILKEMRAQNLSITFAVNADTVLIMEALVLTFTPALCAGMLSTQVEKIKILLFDKHFDEKVDPVKILDIERFIRYIEARGCRFRVCKLIPLDTDLIGMVLSFCVTYLIVIIQFTHVY